MGRFFRCLVILTISASSADETLAKSLKLQNETEVVRELPDYNPDPNPVSYILKEHPNIVEVEGDDEYTNRVHHRDFVANLIAGRTEFPWIVDVRVDEGKRQQPELWATGNLVTFIHVFTTCRAVKIMMREEPGDAEINILERLLLVTMTVNICTSYLSEKYARINSRGQYTYQNSDNFEYGSRRLVQFVLYHPGCEYGQTLDNDAALLTLQFAVPPQLPVVSFMPWIRDPLSNKPALFTEDYMRYEWQACYVGSFGKPYANYPDNILRDYKVRFRAYYTSWFTCKKEWIKMCENNIGETVCRIRLQVSTQLICMETRSKVGTVCDHDRGAPIVCDDEVVGFVNRGAISRYCNNVIPIPFIVMKLTAIDEWLETLPKRLLSPVTTTKRPTTCNRNHLATGRFHLG